MTDTADSTEEVDRQEMRSIVDTLDFTDVTSEGIWDGMDFDSSDGEHSNDLCQSDCWGRLCGDDGCGGTCGECGESQICSDLGVCIEIVCYSTKDCPGDLVCAKEIQKCVECASDSDCGNGKICGPDYACLELFQCTSDKDCKAQGMVCDSERGKCVECLHHTDCLKEEYCFEFYCFPDVCSAGTTECEENGVRTCAPDGSGWGAALQCGADEYCEAGDCQKHLCSPNEKWCDGDVALLCSADGKKIETETDCSLSSSKCINGICIATLCTPATSNCLNEFEIEICSEDGMSKTNETCAKDTHCSSGKCIPLKCPPNEIICIDDFTVMICSEDGLNNILTICPKNAYCSDGECIAFECIPNDTYCKENKAVKCNEDGHTYDILQDCTATEELCADGECICKPSCDGKECGDDGCGGSCGECAEGQFCIQGKCPPIGSECDDGNFTDWDGCTNGKISEFRINDTLTGMNYLSDVSTTMEGGYVVLWIGGPVDSSQDLVYARIFAPQGYPLGNEIIVNASGKSQNQSQAKVAVHSSGMMLLAWSAYHSDYPLGQEVMYRCMTKDATLLGEEMPISLSAQYYQYRARVAALPNGFVVTWVSKSQSGATYSYYGQLLDTACDKVGAEFVLAPQTSESVGGNTVVSSDDRFLYGWADKVQCNFRTFSPSGDSLAPTASVSPCYSGLDTARGKDDTFLLAYRNSSSNADIYLRSLSNLGAELWGPSVVNTTLSGDQKDPVIGSWTGGESIAAWLHPFGKNHIYAQKMDSSGKQVGSELQANIDEAMQKLLPQAAALAEGSFVIAWSCNSVYGSNGAVFAQRFSSTGKRLYR